MENEHRLTRIFAIKTTNRAERSVADNIDKAVRDANNDIRVMSVIVPDELKGYVLVETDEPLARVQELMEHVPSARTVLPGVTSLEEVGHYLVPKPAVSGIDEGTIVELINGPFKGEKAVVKRVDASKEEITVELYESVLPIPITVRGDHVRVIDRRDDDS
ncbi:transcription elongation factor Spt5 [Methanospirillum sp.]|uniref:transcription elongation factor Spt5 n=1 Tax=Methanospirillum sp. TaxID=45200 RepID=UPI0029860435|nr:transcription elongation factor Spt5 [Methanospirillum sp.]